MHAMVRRKKYHWLDKLLPYIVIKIYIFLLPCTTINLELWLRPRLKIIRWVFAIARHACVWTLALEDNHHRGPGVRGGQTKVRSIDRTTYNWRAILIIMMLLGRQLPSPVGMFHAKGLDIDILHHYWSVFVCTTTCLHACTREQLRSTVP